MQICKKLLLLKICTRLYSTLFATLFIRSFYSEILHSEHLLLYNIFFTKSKIIWLLLKPGPCPWNRTLKNLDPRPGP